MLNRYSELAPKYFRVINEHLDSNSNAERQWAVERLDKAFAKMIPELNDLDWSFRDVLNAFLKKQRKKLLSKN